MSRASVLQEATERIRKVLQEYAPEGFTATILAWDLPEAGLRVAEVDWSDGKAGAAFMQSDLPHGLAVCAQTERAIITAAFMNDEDETEREIDLLRFLVR